MSQMFLFILGPPSAPEGPMQFSDITASSCTVHWKAPKSDVKYHYCNIHHIMVTYITSVLYILGPPSAPEGPMQFSDITASSCTVHWKASKSDVKYHYCNIYHMMVTYITSVFVYFRTPICTRRPNAVLRYNRFIMYCALEGTKV